jgi:hypothetical protein
MPPNSILSIGSRWTHVFEKTSKPFLSRLRMSFSGAPLLVVLLRTRTRTIPNWARNREITFGTRPRLSWSVSRRGNQNHRAAPPPRMVVVVVVVSLRKLMKGLFNPQSRSQSCYWTLLGLYARIWRRRISPFFRFKRTRSFYSVRLD